MFRHSLSNHSPSCFNLRQFLGRTFLPGRTTEPSSGTTSSTSKCSIIAASFSVNSDYWSRWTLITALMKSLSVKCEWNSKTWDFNPKTNHNNYQIIKLTRIIFISDSKCFNVQFAVLKIVTILAIALCCLLDEQVTSILSRCKSLSFFWSSQQMLLHTFKLFPVLFQSFQPAIGSG